MREHEFVSLLDGLRKAVQDFSLFEAVYLRGFSQAELARSLGLPSRTLSRRLEAVRRTVAATLEARELLPDTSPPADPADS